MNDELAAIAGKYEDLVGRLQERYGIAKEQAEGRADDFKKMVDKLKTSKSRLVQLQASMRSGQKAVRKPVVTRTPLKKRRRAG